MKTSLPPLTLAFLFALALNAGATTRYVDLNSPNPTPPYTGWLTAATNIQDAIDVSADRDLVLVADGLYGTGGRVAGTSTTTNRVAVTKAVTLQSVNGPGAGVIQGFQVPGTKTGNAAVRCIYLTNGASLVGFTLTNGATKSERGGGILCESTNVVVSNCWVLGNAASDGAGIYRGMLWSCVLSNNSSPLGLGGGTLTSVLYNSIIVSNRSDLGAGADDSTLSNCVVLGNSCDLDGQGGGANHCTLTDCLVSGNYGGLGSGGAQNSTSINCLITSNSSSGSGGGVIMGSLFNCVVADNACNGTGGGVYGCAVTNTIIKRNFAKGNGGGAFNSTVVNSLISANASGANGGGVYGGIVYNSTIVGNVATNGGGVAFAASGSVWSSIVYHNTAVTNENYTGTVFFSASCTLPAAANGSGNITNEPGFIDLVGGNLRLQTNSPCINAGAIPPVFTFDLDRRNRIVGTRIDMGAYEFQGAVTGEFIGWLEQSGLPTDGSADFTDADADGMNNYGEWRSDTIPTNALSVLRIISATNTATGANVTWQSVATRSYWLERATNLGVASSFQTVATNITGAAGLTSYADLTATNGGPYFYRVGVQ